MSSKNESANLERTNELRSGAEHHTSKLDARKGICRIIVGGDRGTGFLIQFKGVLCVMTNHHVLSSVNAAIGASAEFRWQSPETMKYLRDLPEVRIHFYELR